MDTQVLIVGAGLAGAATAFHLRRLGLGDLVLIEKEAMPGVHSSGRNAAMVREWVADESIQTVTTPGAYALRGGALCDFRQTGSVLIGRGDHQASARFALATGQGLWCPGDGVVDVAGLLNTYLRDVHVRYDTELLDWSKSPPGLCVRTNRGVARTRVLVNAAGPWAAAVGDIPLTPTNRHLFQTTTMPEVDPSWPFVWDVVHGMYFRPESGGLLMCVCDEQARPPGDYRIDHDVEEELAEALVRLQPKLQHVAIRTRWTGQRTFGRDRRFAIGFDPRCDALFHVAGLGGHGVTASHEVGRLAAELIAAGPASTAGPFDPARLVSVDADGVRSTDERGTGKV